MEFPSYIDGEPEELTQARLKWIDAETNRVSFEAREAEADAITAEIEVKELSRKYDEFLSNDNFHHVYRFNSSVRGKTVANCLGRLKTWSRLDPGCDMEIIFNSPGGDITEGMALFDFIQGLRQSGHKVTTGSAGMAASMAGILLQAGDHRWVGQQTWILIHRASFGAAGSTFDVEDQLEFIKRLEQRVVDIFVARSELDEDTIRDKWDRKDWWIPAEEALELNLVDEIKNKLPEGPQ